jgi:hypothetical protein
LLAIYGADAEGGRNAIADDLVQDDEPAGRMSVRKLMRCKPIKSRVRKQELGLR